MTRPDLEAPRVEAFELGGDPARAPWDRAPEVTLLDVESGAPPRQPTRARVLHDGARLYVLLEAEDEEIHAPHTEPGDPVYEAEALEVFVDPFGDARSYFEFGVNPLGVVFDALVVNRLAGPHAARDLDTLADWTCPGLRVAAGYQGELGVAGGGERWWVELAIPFEALAPPEPPGPEAAPWGLGLFRVDRGTRGDEYQAWSPTGRVDFHRPAAFGVLRFG